MPQADFSPDSRRDTGVPDFNFFKLKLNETARVVMLEHPTYAWVHTLRAPKIILGQAVKVTKERKGGESYVDYEMDFLGRPTCLGDLGAIADKGSDPANCPVCKAAKEGGEVGSPERRFAVNLIRYGLDSAGKPVIPFNCSCVVWVFTEGYYDKLYKIQQEHGELRGRDLLLGPCQIPENMQRFDVNPGAKSVWQLDEQVKQLVLGTFKNNRADNLEKACGRLTERRFIERDLESMEQRWAIARGAPVATNPALAGADLPNLTQGLESLLAATPAPAPAAAPAAVDLSGLLNGLGGAPATPTTPAPTPAGLADLFGGAAPATPTAPAGFADLFAGAPETPPPAPAPAAAPPPTAPTTATAPTAVDFDQLLASL